MTTMHIQHNDVFQTGSRVWKGVTLRPKD